MEQHPILVLLDVGRYLAERQDDGGGLGGSPGGVGERVGTEGMVEDVGPARQQEPCGIGEEGRGGGAVAVEVPLDRLAIVFTIAPGTIEVCIHLLRRWTLSGGPHTARVVPGCHDLGFDDHPPRLVPRGGSIGELLKDTAAGGGLLALGGGHGRLPPEQLARFA